MGDLRVCLVVFNLGEVILRADSERRNGRTLVRVLVDSDQLSVAQDVDCILCCVPKIRSDEEVRLH